MSLCLCGCGEQPRPNRSWILGHNQKAHNNGGVPAYKDGYRYCSGCEDYYKTKAVYCPSQNCNTRLRIKPRHKI